MPRDVTPESQAIAAEYYHFALKIAARYIASRPWFEDEITEQATMALLRASRSYDGTVGPRLTTYIGICVERACNKLMAQGRHRGYLRRREHLRGGEPSVFTGVRWGDLRMECRRQPDPAATAIRSEAAQGRRLAYEAIVREMYGRADGILDGRERKVLRRLLVEGMNASEVGRTLGMQRSNVYKIRDSAMTKLRDRFRAA